MHDLRYALRLIAKNWSFSLTVILILALCIGDFEKIEDEMGIPTVQIREFYQKLAEYQARDKRAKDN